VRRVAYTGGTSSVIVANMADGLDGRRLGVGVWNNTLYYSFQGINIATGYMRNCLLRANIDGTSPSTTSCYSNTTTWWYSDLQISRGGRIFVSEFRNTSGSNPPPTNNIQANTLPTTGSWTLLMSGLTPADEVRRTCCDRATLWPANPPPSSIAGQHLPGAGRGPERDLVGWVGLGCKVAAHRRSLSSPSSPSLLPLLRGAGTPRRRPTSCRRRAPSTARRSHRT